MLMDDIDRYLALRRSLGFSLRVDECLLRSFARFAADRGETQVRATTAVEWAALGPSPGQRDRRLRRVVLFARHVRAEESGHEVPPANVFSCWRRPYLPHIYTVEEIRQILGAASGLGPTGSLRPHTYRCLLGLLASTGLRVSEAIALDLGDVTSDGLIVRCTKFQKSRLVPMHATVTAEVEQYIERRLRFHSADGTMFVSLRRRPLVYQEVNRTFLGIVRSLGLHPGPGKRGPRIHDFRHTVAVRALEGSPSGHDGVGRHMRALSTYLGHSTVATNYRYLHSTPQLMTDLADACEDFLERDLS
jgi:integrase